MIASYRWTHSPSLSAWSVCQHPTVERVRCFILRLLGALISVLDKVTTAMVKGEDLP